VHGSPSSQTTLVAIAGGAPVSAGASGGRGGERTGAVVVNLVGLGLEAGTGELMPDGSVLAPPGWLDGVALLDTTASADVEVAGRLAGGMETGSPASADALPKSAVGLDGSKPESVALVMIPVPVPEPKKLLNSEAKPPVDPPVAGGGALALATRLGAAAGALVTLGRGANTSDVREPPGTAAIGAELSRGRVIVTALTVMVLVTAIGIVVAVIRSVAVADDDRYTPPVGSAAAVGVLVLDGAPTPSPVVSATELVGARGVSIAAAPLVGLGVDSTYVMEVTHTVESSTAVDVEAANLETGAGVSVFGMFDGIGCGSLSRAVSVDGVVGVAGERQRGGGGGMSA